jgi:hypothetical protein
MKLIKELFDENKNIYRAIEKVVTFGNIEHDALKREVSEYVVTPRIKDNFEKILDDLYTGMDAGTSEVGIWVSGFYGSGKSSFSKYLGLALNKDLEIENVPFSERLANRINSNKISQLIKTINQRHNPVIFLIDLATQQISGYDLAPVSTIIYNEVMKWAGYASEGKIALLERTLEMDDRLDEFKETVKKEKGVDWDEIKFQDILKAKGIAQDMACRFYPTIWSDRRAFNVMKIEDIENERERMQRMLDLIKKRKGKDKVLFIIDEVGQYIAAKEQLILQLQGTMENIKDIGHGKAWLLATAQQTLTEDNPNARFNSDKLFKLNDRFPVKVEVEASDIKEITTQRLLGKSNEGAALLKKKYQEHGERLRLLTRLEKTQGTPYQSDLDEKNFVDLYPFLPIHFDILLNLLGKLARKTGGVGLRSALRVIQDVLTEKAKGQLAEEKIGTLANTVNIYDILKSDIRKSYSHVIAAVDKVIEIDGEDSFHTRVAKSIAVLQLLDDLFLSVENLAALMQPSVESPSILEQVKEAVHKLKRSPSLTLKEIDGQLRFMTEAITNIEKEKNNIYVGGTEMRRVLEGQLEDVFKPVPTARIFNTKTVKTGIILNHEERLHKLAEQNETVQTEIRFVPRAPYKGVVDELLKTSTERTNANKIYLVGLLEDDLSTTLEEIVRCQEIGSTRTRYNDKEILDYLNSQLQEAERMRNEVRRKLVQAMKNGEFVFRGKSRVVKSGNKKLRESCNYQLKEVAEKVFEKYKLAPVNVEGLLAQKLLQFEELKNIPTTLNPFDLIKSDGSIDVSALCLKEIEEYLNIEGQVEGKKLLEHFENHPYGWSKDTSRYLVTVMFLASELKLRIAGEDVKVKGQKAKEALKNVQGFKKIGISLFQEGKPTMEQVKIARDHIIQLTGETPAPLHQKISECVNRRFPEFRQKYATIGVKLDNLNLPGADKAQAIQDTIDLLLLADSSNAPFILGKKDAPLFHNLVWAKEVDKAFNRGIEKKVKKVQQLQADIQKLPPSGIPGELAADTEKNFELIERILQNDNFFEKEPELNEAITEVETQVEDYFQKFLDKENERIKYQIEALKRSSQWAKLNDEQKGEFAQRLPDQLQIQNSGIKGIHEILNESFGFSQAIDQVKEEIEEAIQVEEPIPEPGQNVVEVNIRIPSRLRSLEELDRFIDDLEALKKEFTDENTIIKLNW